MDQKTIQTFDNLTNRARRVFGLARQECQMMNHEQIKTHHILMGLILEESGIASNALKELGIGKYVGGRSVEVIRNIVSTLYPKGKGAESTIPFSENSKIFIKSSIEEAQGLGHNYLGTEHLLLGLIKGKENSATKVISILKVTTEEIKKEIFALLGLDMEKS